MNEKTLSFTPAEILLRPDKNVYGPAMRGFQGIPAIERAPGGALYCFFYGGVREEKPGNYGIIIRSLDDGKTWEDPFIIVKHPDPGMRVFDPNVWLDPKGRLWLFYSQTLNYNDGLHGVWCAVCDSPDAESPVFSAPRRIANGVMLNKPTIRSDGAWLMPTAVWVCAPTPDRLYPETEAERHSNVFISTDEGESFSLLGGAEVPNRNFDEHMVVERRDGSLWMLVRRYDGIGEAFSYDGGRTWEGERLSDIAGPCSRFFISRLQSGNLLLVNHVGATGHNRINLMAKISEDDGKTWIGGLMLDARASASYPDGTQAPDGKIYVVNDYARITQREIVMHVFREEDVLNSDPSSARIGEVISRGTGKFEG